MMLMIIAVLTIIVNIGLTFYNLGKNRKIYEIKEMFTGGGGHLENINKLLLQGDYTLLYVGQDFNDTRLVRYVLGRISKGIGMDKKVAKIIAREGLFLLAILSTVSIIFGGFCNFCKKEIIEVFIFIYSIYWTIRFIIWAIRTLKNK